MTGKDVHKLARKIVVGKVLGMPFVQRHPVTCSFDVFTHHLWGTVTRKHTYIIPDADVPLSEIKTPEGVPFWDLLPNTIDVKFKAQNMRASVFIPVVIEDEPIHGEYQKGIWVYALSTPQQILHALEDDFGLHDVVSFSVVNAAGHAYLTVSPQELRLLDETIFFRPDETLRVSTVRSQMRSQAKAGVRSGELLHRKDIPLEVASLISDYLGGRQAHSSRRSKPAQRSR